MSTETEIRHATCVAIDGCGVLITGPSGAGKSALALQLIGMGAQLVSDDRTEIFGAGPDLMARAPESIAGLIEARGVGIIELPYLAQARLTLVVDMAQTERQRLPEAHFTRLLDKPLSCLHKIDAPYFAAGVNAYVRGSRTEHA